MKKSLFTMEHARQLTEDTYELVLSGDTSAITAPGQFVNIELPGKFLRRPISICNWTDNALMLLVKVAGEGTKELVRCVPGTELDVLTGLGNGFDMSRSGEYPLLVGGGVGIPPLYVLAKRLTAQGKRVTAVLGFNRKSEIFLAEEFRALGAEVIIATADGSVGLKGLVTDGMAAVSDYTYLYTCGPEPMLKAVYDACKTSGQFSFEERMGCGFGACMGCSCRTKYGNKRICKEGPVLEKEEIVW